MHREIPGDEEQDPEDLSNINDPGNEDPGSLMDDARVPLLEEEQAPQEGDGESLGPV
ncbi:hypothetical protein [Pseudomonas sp. Fl4BN1]|uniref:hypothetical protein n=1 Tax=Pseudomonas sp. Fl4BN1 TaxID=2697651 RepID=UPI0015B52F20|nr:hypothetical protein [Pseudomonas sp. Fl4BN1]